jgi:hypothetical protein
MAHCKMANAIASFHRLKRKFTAFDLSSIVRVILASLCLATFLSGAVQARDETRVSFSQGYQLNHNDRHAHPSAWWLTPRHNVHGYARAEPYPFHHTRYSRWGNRLSPNSSLSISWGSSPHYHNSGFYQQPRWRHWNGFEDNNVFSPWHNISRAYSTNDYASYVYTNNAYRDSNYARGAYTNSDSDQAARSDTWAEHGYQSTSAVEQNTAGQVPAISRLSTQVSHSSGLTRLPANARVVQQDKGIIYEWQGVSYRFDWSTQTYLAITDKADE